MLGKTQTLLVGIMVVIIGWLYLYQTTQRTFELTEIQHKCTELHSTIEQEYGTSDYCESDVNCTEVFYFNTCQRIAVHKNQVNTIKNLTHQYFEKLECEPSVMRDCKTLTFGAVCINNTCVKCFEPCTKVTEEQLRLDNMDKVDNPCDQFSNKLLCGQQSNCTWKITTSGMREAYTCCPKEIPRLSGGDIDFTRYPMQCGFGFVD